LSAKRAASIVVAGVAACALTLSGAAVRAADFGCSEFGGVESAEACTAAIAAGGHSNNDLVNLYLLRESSTAVGECLTSLLLILPKPSS